MEVTFTNHSTGLRWIIRQSRPARFSLLLVALSSAAGSATSLITTMILKAFTDYAAGESGFSLPFLALSSAATLVLSSVFLLLDALGTRLTKDTENVANCSIPFWADA